MEKRSIATVGFPWRRGEAPLQQLLHAPVAGCRRRWELFGICRHTRFATAATMTQQSCSNGAAGGEVQCFGRVLHRLRRARSRIQRGLTKCSPCKHCSCQPLCGVESPLATWYFVQGTALVLQVQLTMVCSALSQRCRRRCRRRRRRRRCTFLYLALPAGSPSPSIYCTGSGRAPKRPAAAREIHSPGWVQSDAAGCYAGHAVPACTALPTVLHALAEALYHLFRPPTALCWRAGSGSSWRQADVWCAC